MPKPVKLSNAINAALQRGWAMEPSVFGLMVDLLERHARGETVAFDELRAAAKRGDDTEDQGPQRPPVYQRVGNVGLVRMKGVIARHASQVNGLCQEAGTSVEEMRAAIRQGRADDEVQHVLFDVDSPGGYTDEVTELASEIRDLRDHKHVVAAGNGLMASAAYWLASQAHEVYASRGTDVGSIGIVTRVVDTSRAQAAQGVDVHYVTTAAGKTAGAPGQSLRPSDLDAIRASLQGTHDQFIEDLAAGRRRDAAEVSKWATGETWNAARAKAMGLIDDVASFEDVLARLSGGVAGAAPAASPGGGEQAVDSRPGNHDMTKPASGAPEGATSPPATPLSFEAWRATNPEAATAAVGQMVAQALASERTRVAGLFAVVATTMDGITHPSAALLQALQTAAAKPEGQAADLFPAALKATRDLAAAVDTAPAPSATDARRKRADASQEAADEAEGEPKPEEYAEETEDADAAPTAIPTPAMALHRQAKAAWDRMPARARAEHGDYQSFAGNFVAERMLRSRKA